VDRLTKRIVAPQILLTREAPSRARKVIHTSDIILSTVRPNLNTVAYVPSFYNGEIASTGFCVLRAEDKAVNPLYLFYFTQTDSFVSHLTKLATGAGYPAVSDSDILESTIPLPSVTEQKRIAAILDKADRLRRTRRYAQRLSDTFLQSVFVEMFGDSVKNLKNFDIEELGNLVDAFEGGVNFNPTTNGECASEWRVLKISAVTWGDFNPHESKPISRNETFNDTLVVRKGDLLISRANTTELVGAVCMVRSNPPMVLLPDKLWRVKFKKDCRLEPEYVLRALRQPATRKLIGDLATGSSGSMKNISKEKAATLPILVPSRSLQEKFACIVQRFERLRAQQREATRQAEHLFQTLLHKAFSGRL
jgi:type I restriction enzyme S subunit